MLTVIGLVMMGQLTSLTYVGALSSELRSPARVTVGPNGTVFVTDLFADHIARFDSSGNFLGSWAVPEGPIGVAAHPDGRYFVSLRDLGKVAIYDAAFTRTGFLGQGNPQVTFVGPTDIAIANNTGNIYVVDPEGDRVYGFAPNGSLLVAFGTRGSGNGQFRFPSAVAVDETRGRLIVADHDNFRIQVFTTAGVFIRTFGDRNKYPKVGPAEGWTPRTQGLTVDAQGRIYVADAMMCTVRQFDSNGVELAKLLHYGTAPGDLRTPCDLALNSNGTRLYVVSTNNSHVEMYTVAGFRGGDESAPALCAEGSNWSLYDSLRLNDLGGTARLPWWPAPWDVGNGQGEYRTTYNGPHFIETPLVCARCHGIRSQPGGDESQVEGQTVLCMSCHTAGGQALALPIHEHDLADPYGTNPNAADGRGSAHAWGVAAVNTQADSVGPVPNSEMARYLKNGLMKCATCHSGHNSDAGAPYLRVSNTRDAMCKECHAPRNKGLGTRGTHPVGFDYPGGTGEYPPDANVAPLYIKAGNVECSTCHAPHYADSGGANGGEGDGMLLRAANDDTLCQTCHTNHAGHTPGGTWQPTCKECHDPHDPNSRNLSLVSRVVRNRTLGVNKPVVFTARSGPNSFDDGDPAAKDGICQVCHTATTYHKHDGTGVAHHDGETCTDCHPHGGGFMPTGGSCLDCHSVPQDNGDNVPPGGRRAVVGEFPVSNAHAHYGAQLGGDACVVCHSQTTHMDGYVDLIDPDDPNHIFRFVRAADLTHDPDVSNFCNHCHDANGATRLSNPLDPFGNGNRPPDVASKFQGTLRWNEWYGDFCFGEEGTLRAVNSHHDVSEADQTWSGAKLECLNCHGAHTAAASQKVADPFQPTTAWTGSGNGFCLACHNGGSDPNLPGFPPGVAGPTVPLRGIDSCSYDVTPWWVGYRWTNSAHGPNSKRGWPTYSGAPAYDMPCVDCHDPHGSWTPTNTAGNPYAIRDVVDGTMYVDDGYRYAQPWTGPPWNTYGTARSVVVPINGVTVGWGGNQGLCAVCHPTWLATLGSDWWHDTCDACQSCHNHGAAWGEYDWGDGTHDAPCPSMFDLQVTRPPAHDRGYFRQVVPPPATVRDE